MRRKSMAQAAIGRGGSPVRAQEKVGDASACEVVAMPCVREKRLIARRAYTPKKT